MATRNQVTVEQRSMEGIAQLILEHEENGSPLIDAPGVVDGVRETLFDAGFLSDEDDGDETEETE